MLWCGSAHPIDKQGVGVCVAGLLTVVDYQIERQQSQQYHDGHVQNDASEVHPEAHRLLPNLARIGCQLEQPLRASNRQTSCISVVLVQEQSIPPLGCKCPVK